MEYCQSLLPNEGSDFPALQVLRARYTGAIAGIIVNTVRLLFHRLESSNRVRSEFWGSSEAVSRRHFGWWLLYLIPDPCQALGR